MLVGVHIPRFDLAVAAHEHGVATAGAPLALAPLDGGAGPIGEVSSAAAAAGVRPGMRTAPAHAPCPPPRPRAPRPPPRGPRAPPGCNGPPGRGGAGAAPARRAPPAPPPPPPRRRAPPARR